MKRILYMLVLKDLCTAEVLQIPLMFCVKHNTSVSWYMQQNKPLNTKRIINFNHDCFKIYTSIQLYSLLYRHYEKNYHMKQ